METRSATALMGCPLVDFRLGDSFRAFQKIEVAAFVGLAHVLGEELIIAARIIARRRLERLDPRGDFLVAQVQLDRALAHVDADLVAVAHSGARAAYRRFRRHGLELVARARAESHLRSPPD